MREMPYVPATTKFAPTGTQTNKGWTAMSDGRKVAVFYRNLALRLPNGAV